LVMTLVPVLLAWWYVPGDGKTLKRAVAVGTNSLAISAACHPSSLTGAGEEGVGKEKGGQSPEVDESGSLWSDEKGREVGDCLAESRIRWGVVTVPEEFYEGKERCGEVGHLTFGVREDGVERPIQGRYYV